MMKKITTLFACMALVALAFTVSAQSTKGQRVTKQIKAFSWLDVAVVDGNQVEGGLHVYTDWTNLAAELKPSQVKIGMMVALTGAEAGTYRLTKHATTTAAPIASEFVRVGGAVYVPGITERNAYTDATKALLDKGTIFIVEAGTSGLREEYVYIGGSGADAIDDSKCWLLLTNNEATGFIAYGNGSVVYNKDGVDKTGVVTALSMSDRAKGITKFTKVEFDIKPAGAPFISFPQSWNKPTFYVNDGTDDFVLNDCWTVKYVDKDGVMYQEWTASDDFTAGVTAATLKLIVR